MASKQRKITYAEDADVALLNLAQRAGRTPSLVIEDLVRQAAQARAGVDRDGGAREAALSELRNEIQGLEAQVKLLVEKQDLTIRFIYELSRALENTSYQSETLATTEISPVFESREPEQNFNKNLSMASNDDYQK